MRSDTTNGLDVDVTRLPALVAGTANIGDVDVLTVPAPLSTTGNGTAATALRVTVASDSTGVIGVGDNGGSLTVDGTVAISGAVDTELPAAAALADATANPTTPLAGAALMGFNGTTWDRVRTANTGRLQVDVISGGSVAQGGDVAHDSVDSGNPVKIGGKAVTNTTVPTAVAAGDRVQAWFDQQGAQAVFLTDDDGTLANVSTAGDAVANAGGLRVFNMPHLWNGSNWDRIRSLQPFDTAVSAPPRFGIAAAAQPDQRFTSVNLGTVVGNTQAWDCNATDACVIHVGTTTTGTMLFEVTADGTNYLPAEVLDVATDLWASALNLTPTANKVYRIRTNGFRTVRARTITTLGATVALTTTLAARSIQVAAVDVGPAPHNIGYTITGKTAQYTSAQTGAALWTPASGRRLVITSYQIQAGGTVGGTIQLWFGASADTTYTRGTDLAIFDGEVLPSATLKPGIVQTGVWPASAVDHILRVTNTGTINPLTFTVWGYEALV